MFVGRTQELNKLNHMYKSDNFEFAVFYGRRRVGKTTLINEFCKDKKTIYFMGIESTEKENLKNFSQAVFQVTEKPKELPAFDSFQNLMNYVGSVAESERLVLVIDEYPYLAQSNQAISSILQEQIDHKLKNGKLFLILCGSSMSFMEYQVLGYKSPLYGRRTAQFKVNPFTFKESSEMLHGFSNEDKAILYGATGGIPEYLSRIDNNRKVKGNIVELFLNKSGRLFEEPSNLLKQELRDPVTYNAIIAAIASGASKINEIATKVGIESSACSNRLSSLISLGLVRKEMPVTENAGKKTIYVLEDQMFRFWYRFVLPNINAIVANNDDKSMEILYEKKIEPLLSAYMGYVFEEICKEYLWSQMFQDKTPFFFSKMGRWWGTNNKLRREEEIDILAFDGDFALYGECKWTNALVDSDVVISLMEKSKLFHYSNCYFYIFSKSGFTDKCQEAVKGKSNIKLITAEEMMGA